MKLKLPPYVKGFADRHGKPRYYFRRLGYQSVTLPGLPWSPAFMAAHEAAMNGEKLESKAVGASRSAPGTIAALVAAYLSSAEYESLALETRRTYRGVVDRFRVDHGEKQVSTLPTEAIGRMMAARARTPAAANSLLRMIRVLMRFAIVHGWRKTDPTIGVKPYKIRTQGFYTWAEVDIEKFEAQHRVGTRARLAFDLLLYTAQRRGDVVTLGRQHTRGGVLKIRQKKTGMQVEIPLHPDLIASLDATKNDHLTFLVTENGKPFTPAGFGNWFGEMCRQAELPEGCSAHGLRKAASRRLAEAGASAHTIMAITGHQTLKEVTRYTQAANRAQLAASGVSLMGKRKPSVKP